MHDGLEDFRNSIIRQGEALVETVFDDLAKSIAMQNVMLESGQRMAALNRVDTPRPERLLRISHDNEYFEICQSIKILITYRKKD